MALAIPCSAQLGVVLGLLGGMTFAGTVIWAVTILFVLLFSGWLAGKLVRGDASRWSPSCRRCACRCSATS